MPRYTLSRAALLPTVALLLAACTPIEETYEATKLPGQVTSAVLRVKSGKGELRVEYPDQVVISEGRIEALAEPRSFALVRDDTSDNFTQINFVWTLETNAWTCGQCLKAVKGPANLRVQWVKR